MKKFFLIISGLYIAGTLVSAAGPWELKKNKNGITVYTRVIENSSLKEFKASIVLETKIDTILAVIDDLPEYPSWMHNCRKAYRIKKLNDNEGYTYTETKAPWPVSNRDVVVRYKRTTSADKKTVKITLKSADGMLAEQKGIVRVRKLSGSWTFEEKQPGKVRATYQIHSDPGGSIPDIIANSAVTDLPYQTLLKLSRKVKEGKYQK